MKSKLLINNNSENLLIFASGWGCDDVQFQEMNCSNADVLILWDYEDFDLDFDFSKYKNFDLLCYSAGVFVAGIIENRLPKLNRKVAINGNPEFIDEHFGVTRQIRKIFRNINDSNVIDFCREYLSYDENGLEILKLHSSMRSFDSCNKELDFLERVAAIGNYPRMVFDRVYLSADDKIFNHEAQLEYYYKTKAEIVVIKSANHNIFYSRYCSFNDFFVNLNKDCS